METNEIILYNNPFCTIRTHVPELVWDFYFEQLKETITEMGLGYTQSQSWRNTIIRYSMGERKYTALYKIDYRLKAVLQDIYPIVNEDFWYGTGEQMDVAAKEIAAKMMADFEALFETQKSKLPNAA
jgi:hypothetical protein